MDRDSLFASVRKAVLSQPYKTYKSIAEEHGVSVPTVQQVAAILRKETGFHRRVGRPLGSGKVKLKQVNLDPTSSVEHEHFYTCKQIAEFLGVSEEYALKRLPAYRAGRRVLFLKSEVIAALGPAIIGHEATTSDGRKTEGLIPIPENTAPEMFALQIAKPLHNITTAVPSVELPTHKNDGEEQE
jgi:hypothetical protein